MTRKMAAQYMGRCPATFDKIRHKFVVAEDGLVRYDRVLMDRYIDLQHAA